MFTNKYHIYDMFIYDRFHTNDVDIVAGLIKRLSNVFYLWRLIFAVHDTNKYHVSKISPNDRSRTNAVI